MGNADRPVTGLFVYNKGDLNPVGGGAQICSREYFQTLEAAGFSLTPFEVQPDRRTMTRLRRHLFPSPYKNLFNLEAFRANIKAALNPSVEYVFVNQIHLAPLASVLRQVAPPTCKLVLLSHGLLSLDYLHRLRISGPSPFAGASKLQRLRLAQRLIDETLLNRHFDHIFCLAPFEIEIEHWLGGRNVSYVPRTIQTRALNWQPHEGRLGFVGRLDHYPNAEGLELFLEALQRLASDDVRVRMIGSPQASGHALARRFPMVEYLGELSDEQLAAEASTWSCFVHPLFCYAMGCSTKLAVALGWRIPIVTTTPGHRGYLWREGTLPVADDPKALAKLALEMSSPAAAYANQLEVSKIADSSPQISQVAAMMRTALGLDEPGSAQAAIEERRTTSHGV